MQPIRAEFLMSFAISANSESSLRDAVNAFYRNHPTYLIYDISLSTTAKPEYNPKLSRGILYTALITYQKNGIRDTDECDDGTFDLPL